jgi:hypothetical protein
MLLLIKLSDELKVAALGAKKAIPVLTATILLLSMRIELVLFENFGINHITIQPEFKKEDPKDFIVQD